MTAGCRVTPFVVTLRSGKAATHVDWHADEYHPDHQPQPGERIFVDLTPERAEEAARRLVERWWDDGEFPMRERFADQESAVRSLVSEFTACGGEPDLIEVPASHANHG